MKLYTLQRTQMLPTDLQTAWSFFSDPLNLPHITPPWLGFHIKSPLPDKMHAGMIAEYSVNPFPLLEFTWITEITHAQEPVYFVDEQRFGPYRFWHHQHHFAETDGGVIMRDLVNYMIPFSFLGNSIAPLVAGRLRIIFDYRYKTLQAMSW